MMAPMVFYYYEEAMKPVTKVSVDGLVPNSFHLSHWIGNATPPALKADTATEIALNFISGHHHKSLFPYANIITNNHFDTDGLLAVFTLLHPRQAESIAPTLIAAAEAGDFCSFSSEEGVQIHLMIERLCQAPNSPLREGLVLSSGPKEAFYYKALLPLLPDLLKQRETYRHLWKDPFDRILASMALFEKETIGIEEFEEERLTVIVDHVRPARQAIDFYSKGDLFLIVEDQEQYNKRGGYGYELLYRYYAWADTVRRPMIPRIPMEHLAEHLNREEGIGANAPRRGRWKALPSGPPPNTAALVFTDNAGNRCLSRISPDGVTQAVLSCLQKAHRDVLV